MSPTNGSARAKGWQMSSNSGLRRLPRVTDVDNSWRTAFPRPPLRVDIHGGGGVSSPSASGHFGTRRCVAPVPRAFRGSRRSVG